jgi:hypothetical protein
MKLIWLLIMALSQISLAGSQMPLDYVASINNLQQMDILSIRNYDTGASMTEVYTDVEKLSTNTQVNTRSYGTDAFEKDAIGKDQTCPNCGSNGGLVASIDSNVIGKAHIAWQSVDAGIAMKGRRPLIGRSIMDLSGVFSIEKFIQLWAGSQPGEISVDWLPCS